MKLKFRIIKYRNQFSLGVEFISFPEAATFYASLYVGPFEFNLMIAERFAEI